MADNKVESDVFDAARPPGRNHVIDLRSDTVTMPSTAMRETIAAAIVGDDVFGDDPTVSELEQTVASILGKKNALFFPSGTQSNLAAILSHCGRGDEMIVGDRYHTFGFEAGGASALGGISYCPIPAEIDGSIDPARIKASIKVDDPHFPMSRLLCLENTFLGSAVTVEKMRNAADAAKESCLSVHLDGARLFNAATELGANVRELAECADTVSLCLSKGLGAPAGSVLSGPEAVIARARRNRKMLGGGMRQSGILAAAGLYALEHNTARLHEDHRRAKSLALALKEMSESFHFSIRQATNMVFITPCPRDRVRLCSFLENRGILVGKRAPTIRIVTHLDVDDADIEVVADAIRQFFRGKD